MAHLLTGTTFRGFTDDGAPLVGGLLHTYASGTTTDQATYTDAALTTPHQNPITLNARGEAEIWLDPTKIYTFHLAASTGATVGTDVDDIQPAEGALSGTGLGQGASRVGMYGGGTAQDAISAVAIKPGGGDDRAALAAADAVAAARGVTLILAEGNFTLGSSITFASRVEMRNGAKIQAAAGAVITFAGGFDAGINYCLDITNVADAPIFGQVDKVLPEWFGAFPITSGSSDVTHGLQVALNTGQDIHLTGPGSYWHNGLTYSKSASIKISGAGKKRVNLYDFSTGSTDSLVISTDNPVEVTGFRFLCGAGKTGGDAVRITGATGSTENAGSTVHDCAFLNYKQALHMLSCTRYRVYGNEIDGNTTYGMLQENVVNNDGGDNWVYKNTFSAASGGFNVIWQSGGGFWCSENKILGGANGVFINGFLTTSTQDIFILNNSIENQSASGIAAARSSGTGGLSNVHVMGNQIDGPIAPIQFGALPSGYMHTAKIKNNNIKIAGTGVNAINITQIDSLDYGDNTIWATSGAPTALVITSSVTGSVRPDTLIGTFTTKISCASNTVRFIGHTDVATTASASTMVLPLEASVHIISGTATINTITALGWSGRTVTLVFQGALTVVDGSNLKLGGNFVTTADDAITLVCDGTNWYQAAPGSAN